MLPTRMFLRVEQVDDLARHAEAGDEDARAALDHALDAVLDLAGHRGQQVDAERLRRQLADLCHLLRQLVDAHRRRAERADAAGLADRGDESVVAHAAHAGEHDRVFDVEQFGEPGAHAGRTVVRHAAGRRQVPGRRQRPRGATRDGVRSTSARGSSSNIQRAKLRRVQSLVAEHADRAAGAALVAPATRLSAADIRWSATSWWRTVGLVRARARRRAASAPAATIASAASRPVSNAWPMPSPVIVSVAIAASPTNSARPCDSVARSMPAGIGHAVCRSSSSTSGPSASTTCGRVQQLGPLRLHVLHLRRRPSRWMPKPMFTRPSGSGKLHM